MSSFVIDDYRLDITPQGNYPVVYLSQFEDGRDIRFYMLNRGRSFTIPTGISAFVSGLKSNGGYYEHTCTIDGNYVIMPVEADMTDASGRGLANIKLTNQSGDTVISAKFVVNVQESVSDSGIEVPTVAETVFQQLLDEIRQQSATISVNVTQLNNNVTQFMADINNKVNVIDNNVSAVDARMDTFIAQHSGVSANATRMTETTLWSGKVYTSGDMIYADNPVTDYDYIDVYYNFAGNSAIQRFTPDVLIGSSGGVIRSANLTNGEAADNMPLAVFEIGIHTIAGDGTETQNFTIDFMYWSWNGQPQSASVQTLGGNVNARYVYKLVGVKYEAVTASKDTELTDVRVGIDGTVYTTAGAAVRGQISDVNSDLTAIDDRVSELESGGDSTITTYLGQTPITLTDDTDVKLVAQEQTTYTFPEFLADYNSPTTDDVEVRLTNTTITREGGKMIFTAVGDNVNQCFADLRLNNLTVGEKYTLVVTRGEYISGTTGGTVVIYDRNGEELGSTGDIAQDEVTLDFVATTPFARVRFFPTTNYYLETYNIKTATIVSAVVYSKRSGTFSSQIRLGILLSGSLIESNPSCEVYALTQKEEITVDDALSTTSRNPVQNRRITAAMGDLANLRTTDKSNLVAAINEAVNSSGSRLAGKVCVFLGDSVAAFRNPPEDIPSIVGLQTGMTVYNCAFGGCRISDYAVAEGTDDPWEAFCFARLADGISTGDWTYQEANIDKLQELDYTGYSPSDHFTTLKGVNWNNVDYCVIFFAGNDPGAVRFDDPNDDDNTYYYLGAFRYSIRKLLTAYPHLKLLVVGTDYHKTGGSNTDDREYTIDGQIYHYYDWSDRLMAECKNFKIPTLDWYRSNGLNALTVDYYMTSDGKHPNYIGNQLLAGQIAARLLSQY